MAAGVYEQHFGFGGPCQGTIGQNIIFGQSVELAGAYFDPTPSMEEKGSFKQNSNGRTGSCLSCSEASARNTWLVGIGGTNSYTWRRAGATCRHACACHARLVTCRFGRGRRLLAPLLDESDSEGERVTQLPGLPPSRRRGRRRQSQQPTPRSLSLRNKMLIP